MSENHIPFDVWDDSTSLSQGAGKTIDEPLKDLPWNQQMTKMFIFPDSRDMYKSFGT